jgi:calmodulin-regulated spectrin-associated protein
VKRSLFSLFGLLLDLTGSIFVFLGPKLFKRLTTKSNKLTIVNSLNQLVLAGMVNAQIRKQVIEVRKRFCLTTRTKKKVNFFLIEKDIEASDARHFVILFRDYHLQYRGVYSYTSETDYIEKVTGQGPQKISEDMIEKYYK